MEHPRQMLRLAAVGDIHCTRKSHGVLRKIFNGVNERADVLLLCGDLTDYGLPEEAQVLVGELSEIKIPIVAVLGNHDHESDHAAQVTHILTEAGVTVLDGDSCEVEGVGFAGAKGFAGGFEGRSLEPWGEKCIKSFVHEAVDEALKLEAALARLDCPQRVAVLHYSPIRATVEGEPPEIFAFLGSRRLEEPLNRFGVSAVFHGHAHHGSPEGVLRSGARVYNVAMPVLKRTFPNQPPYRVVELGLSEPSHPLPEHLLL